MEAGGKPGGNNNPDGLGGKSGKHIDNLSITKVVNQEEHRVTNTTDYKARRLAKNRPDIHNAATRLDAQRRQPPSIEKRLPSWVGAPSSVYRSFRR